MGGGFSVLARALDVAGFDDDAALTGRAVLPAAGQGSGANEGRAAARLRPGLLVEPVALPPFAPALVLDRCADRPDDLDGPLLCWRAIFLAWLKALGLARLRRIGADTAGLGRCAYVLT